MPIYEYKCDNCDAHIELMQKMCETAKKCPECGKKKLKKQFSQTRYHDTYSPMHPRRGRGVGGHGRVDPGEGMQGMVR